MVIGPRAMTKPSSENCEILQAGRREMPAVDLGHAPRGAADAKAGAFGGRQAERGGDRHGRQIIAAACPGKASMCICT